jgi:CheY-like chemotaxis protein
LAEAFGGRGVSGPARILLVEDDEIDAEIVRRAFRDGGSSRPIIIARDGIEALEVIRGGDGRPGLARPYLVLLDLRMPRMSGPEFLTALRGDPAIRDLPVFVMSTSAAERHKAEAYAHGVAGYIVKQDNQEAMTRIARMLDAYCDLVALP